MARSGEAVREQQLEAFYERFGSLVRDAVGLGITEDELWERFDAEFERVCSRASGTEENEGSA